MYRNCIFCSSALGENESLEGFPVGSTIAFDSRKGRLWSVCRHCARWNLAPLEERWEPIEDAEKQFRDSRLRVHSENIGLAKLRDGTRLIRVGEAVPRELAAWRYGDQLVRRRNQFVLWGGVGVTGASALVVGGSALIGAGALAPVVFTAFHGVTIMKTAWLVRNQHRVLYRWRASDSAPATDVPIRVAHMMYAQLIRDPDREGIAIRVPSFAPPERVEDGGIVRWTPRAPYLIRGSDAELLLSRTMTRANARGAGIGQLDRAFSRLAGAETREAFLKQLGDQETGLFPPSLLNPSGNHTQPFRMPDVKGSWRRFVGTFRGERIAGGSVPVLRRRLAAEDALALEMALHEESERRALDGELSLLQAAWREAEEIAAIADTLPEDPLDRVPR